MRHFITVLSILAPMLLAGTAGSAMAGKPNRGLNHWGDLVIGQTGKTDISMDAAAYARLRQGVIAEVGAGRPATVGLVIKPGTQVGASYGMSFGRLSGDVEVSTVTQAISGLKLSGEAVNPLVAKALTASATGNIRMTTLMSHVYYDLPAIGRVTPYAGAGLGAGKIRLALPNGASEKSFSRYEALAGVKTRLIGPVSVFFEVRTGETGEFAFDADGVASKDKTRKKDTNALCGITTHF